MSTTTPGPTHRLSRQAARRLFNGMLPLATAGRLTLDLLRDLSLLLQNQLGCDAVEIIYHEQEKLWHCDRRRNESPDFFGSTLRPGDDPVAAMVRSLRLHDGADLEWLLKPGDLDSTQVEHRLADFSQTLPPGLLLGPICCGARVEGLFICRRDPRVYTTRPPAEQLMDLGVFTGLSLSHNLAQFQLRERIKELSCMYAVAKAGSRPHEDLDQTLNAVVELLPAGYLYPEITEARIVHRQDQYHTPGFVATPFCQRADIVVEEQVRGFVEVAYQESRPELDEGPFLREERRLIDSVATELALIIERKQAETEQRMLEKKLLHADRLATIGQLAAGMAHELNEPLTGIVGFAELLEEAEDIPAEAREDIRRIERAGLHAREVVRKLLLFAKQIPPRHGLFDLNAIVVEVLSFLRNRLDKENIRVDTCLSADLPDVPGDESQMRQVVLNVVVNAVQAMEKGGLLSIETARDRDGRAIIMRIGDTGPGIPEKNLPQIFLPFFTTKDIHQGTGLGLSVVHGIVKSHGGHIAVESVVGQGAVFTVTLPMTGENAHE